MEVRCKNCNSENVRLVNSKFLKPYSNIHEKFFCSDCKEEFEITR